MQDSYYSAFKQQLLVS